MTTKMLFRIPVDFSFDRAARGTLHAAVHPHQRSGRFLVFLRCKHDDVDFGYKNTAEGNGGTDDHAQAQEGLLDLCWRNRNLRTNKG